MEPVSAEPLSPILIAEDDESDLFLTRRNLARAGLKQPVLTFGSGDAVIEYLAGLEPGAGKPPASGWPRLLFLDLKLPRVDGFGVLRWIRGRPEWRGLKVVVLSGSDEPGDVERAKQLGADRYLTKHPPLAVFAEIIAANGERG